MFFNRAIKAKAEKSEQFHTVATFIEFATEGRSTEISSYYAHLCVCPWTGKKLDNTVYNIDTTEFCRLFPMKSTSCGVHLRKYKELLHKFGIEEV